MVIPRLGGPAGGYTKPRPQDILEREDPQLDPHPQREDGKGPAVGLSEEHVILTAVEVGDGHEAEQGLAEGEAPGEGAAAVSQDVAVDLGDPEGEVGEDDDVDEGRAGGGVPGYGGDEEEEET